MGLKVIGFNPSARSAQSTLDMSIDAPIERRYSTIQRQNLNGQVVYVKQHRDARPDLPSGFTKQRLGAEIQVLDEIAQLRELRGRLGKLELVCFDLANHEITTKEVPGRSLEELVNMNGTTHNLNRALFLCGKWLRVFQTISLNKLALVQLPGSPTDLVQYCRLRIQAIRETGSKWPNSAEESRLLNWIERGAKTANPVEAVLCHHDFGPFNILWDGTTITPIDFTSCGSGHPFTDLSYLDHRLEMTGVESPWKRRGLRAIRSSLLRGFGVPNAYELPVYRVLVVKHALSRLKKYRLRPPKNILHGVHRRWCENRVIKIIQRLTSRG